jgi:hypothetical protein
VTKQLRSRSPDANLQKYPAAVEAEKSGMQDDPQLGHPVFCHLRNEPRGAKIVK